MIYFVQAKDGGPIKIGTTVRLTQRLLQLQAEFREELRVLAVVDGGRSEESDLHRKFAHLRKIGEWFEPGDDLQGFILQEARHWDGEDEIPPDVSTLYVEIPRRLKDLIEESARRNHRKITGEVIMILEEHFSRNSPRQES